MRPRVVKGSQVWRWLPQILCIILVLPPGLGAQQPKSPAQPMAPLPMVQTLRVIALAGNGEVNDLERRIMAPLVVNVLDQNGRPVEGANVVFRFPLNGPSASFPDGEKSKTLRTNADGQAAATGWMANGGIGSFQVHVTASRGNEIGETAVSMANASRIAEEKKSKRIRKSALSSPWVKIGIIAGAAGAVAAIVLATRGGSTPAISAVPGSPTIGGPR